MAYQIELGDDGSGDGFPARDDDGAFGTHRGLTLRHGFLDNPSLRVDISQSSPAYLSPIGVQSGFTAHPITTPATFGQGDEVAFIAGVYPDGTLPLYAFYAWNDDNPATYTGGFTNSSKWGASTAQTPGGTVDYYFTPGSNWSSTEKQFLAAGLSLWSDVANISFTEVSNSSQAQIVFTRGSNGSAATSTSTTGTGDAGETGSSHLLTITKATISIDTSGNGFGPIDGTFTAQGGYPIMTFLHEEGHAIGLGHAGPYNGDVTESQQQFSPYDTRLWSIMSYIEPRTASALYFNQYPVTGTSWNPGGVRSDPTGLMPLDVLAVQQLYGAPVTTPLSGGQTFGFHSNIAGPSGMFFDFTLNTNPILTLWDAGANNTLDLSGFSKPSTVNLNPGTFSSADGMVNNLGIAFNTSIDSVVGGAGNDVFTANNDGDTMAGGGGNDTLNGGGGIDTAVFAGARANFTIGNSGGAFTVTDHVGLGGTDTLTNIEFAKFDDQTITLAASGNQAPALDGGSNTVVFTEGGSGAAINPALIVSDSDSANLSSAAIAISQNAVATDVLAFTDQNGITGSYNSGTHVLTLNGVASVAAYQTALRSVTYVSASDYPNAGSATSRAVTFTVNDGFLTSNTATSTVQVNDVNDPPSGHDNTLTLFANSPLTIHAGDFGFSDIDGGSLAKVEITTLPALGSLTDNGVAVSAGQFIDFTELALGHLVYTPATDGSGTNYAHFTFQVEDDGGTAHGGIDLDPTPNTLTFDVTPPSNIAPVLGGAGNTVGYTEQAAGVVIDSGLTVADSDSPNLAGASVTIASGFVAGDALNFAAQNNIAGTYDANTHILTLSGLDSLADYQTALRSVTFSSTSDDPTNGGNTSRTIAFTANDGHLDSAAVTSTVNITAVNDKPVLAGADNTVTYQAGGPAIAIDAAITIADPDGPLIHGATIAFTGGFVAGDVLGFVSQNGISGTYNAASHALTLFGNASLVAYQTALESVTYSSTSANPTGSGANPTRFVGWQVVDGQASGVSDVAFSTINVNGFPNHAPTGGVTIAGTVAENQTLSANTSTLADADGLGTLHYQWQRDSGSGFVNVGADQATYLLGDADVAAHLRVTVSYTDGHGAAEAVTSAQTAAVANVNDPPVLGGGGNTLGYTEQAAPAVIDAALTVSDIDNATLAGASVKIASGFVAGDTLGFANQAGISGSYNAATHILTLSGSASLAAYQTALRSVTFASNSDNPDNFGATPSRSIAFQVDDGQSANHASNIVNSTIAITAVSDPASLHNDAFAVNESYPAGDGLSVFADNGSGADTDPDNVLAVTAVNGVAGNVGHQFALASGALLTVNADGTFQYDPNHVFDALAAPGSGATDTSAGDSFTYTVNGTVETATVTITGADTNDTLFGTSGNDSFDGGAGTDTLVLTGNRANYIFNYNPANQTYTVVDTRGGSPDGTDTMRRVENVHFADGTFSYATVSVVSGSTTTTYDAGGDHPWASQAVTVDAQGSLASQTIVNDGGSHWVNTYDTTSANPWAFKSDGYDGAGRLVTETVTNDDGTRTLTLNDAANQFAWATATISFDASGNVTGFSGANDDASHNLTMADIASTYDTALWFTSPYDADLGAAPENLTLTGGGNADILYGHAGNDALNGAGGNDYLNGGAGNDTLTGGAGDDRFYFRMGDGIDTITDFTAGNASGDVVELHGYGVTTFTALQAFMTQSGADTIIAFDDQNHIVLHNVTLGALNSGDFILS